MLSDDVSDKIAPGKFVLLLDEQTLAWAIVEVVTGGNRSFRPRRLRHPHNRDEDLYNFTHETEDAFGNGYMAVLSTYARAIFDTEEDALAASDIIGTAYAHYMETTQPARDVFLVTAKLMI